MPRFHNKLYLHGNHFYDPLQQNAVSFVILYKDSFISPLWLEFDPDLIACMTLSKKCMQFKNEASRRLKEKYRG